MATTPPPPSFIRPWQRRSQRLGFLLAQQIGSRPIRLLMILAAVIGACWLVYINGWLPLQQHVALPVGVTEHNPELNVSLLQTINNQRVERVQHHSRPYIGVEKLFIQPSPSSTPKP